MIDGYGDNEIYLPENQTVTKEEIQQNIREVIAKERMLKGMVAFFKLEDMLLDVIPDLFVHLLSSNEGKEILNRLDKNGKITSFIGQHSP